MVRQRRLNPFWKVFSVVVVAYAFGFMAAAQTVTYEPSDFDALKMVPVWPVPDIACKTTGGNHGIGSAFGPRVVNGSDDFHEGLDIRGAGGEDVVAVWYGEVHDVRSTSGCGEHVIIRHDMPAGKTIRFQNQQFTRFWTWYCHLELNSIPSTIVAGADVEPGTKIGTLGQTGSAQSPHLHWELRIGNNNRHFSSNNGGYDPNVNPLVLLSDVGAGGMSQCNETDANLTVDINATDGPLVTAQIKDRDHRHNHWVVTITEQGTGNDVAEHELDFDRRLGFDSSVKANLEGGWDKNVPYVRPQSLNTSQNHLEQQLHIPTKAGAWLAGEPEFLHAKVQLFNLEKVQIGQVEFDFTNPHPAPAPQLPLPDPPTALTTEFAHCDGASAVYIISWFGSLDPGEAYDVDKKRGSGSYFPFADGSLTARLDQLSGTTRAYYRARVCASQGCSSYLTRSFRPQSCSGGGLPNPELSRK